MHNILFSVVCIKRGGGAKAQYIHLYTYIYTRIYTSKYVSKNNDVNTRQR